MRTLKRNSRKIYLCNQILNEDTGITTYAKPIPLEINYQPISSSAYLYNFGEHFSQNLQAIVSIEIGRLFKEGDKCYIFVEPPEEHDELCETADYRVNVIPQLTLNEAKITFTRLSGTVERPNA